MPERDHINDQRKKKAKANRDNQNKPEKIRLRNLYHAFNQSYPLLPIASSIEVSMINRVATATRDSTRTGSEDLD